MSQPANDGNPAKAKKRGAGKAANRQDGEKVKLTLYVTADLSRRFAVHATYSDMNHSELFSEMIQQHCRRFVVSDRAKSPEEGSSEAVA